MLTFIHVVIVTHMIGITREGTAASYQDYMNPHQEQLV